MMQINNLLLNALIVDDLDISTLTWKIEEWSGAKPPLADSEPTGVRLWRSEDFKVIKTGDNKYELDKVLQGKVIEEGKSGYFIMESGAYKIQGTIGKHYGDMVISTTERRKDDKHSIQSFSILIDKNALKNLLGEK